MSVLLAPSEIDIRSRPLDYPFQLPSRIPGSISIQLAAPEMRLRDVVRMDGCRR